MTFFVAVAGLLAAAAAALLLWPLVRRREDGRPAGVYTAIGVVSMVLLGSAAMYAALSK